MLNSTIYNPVSGKSDIVSEMPNKTMKGGK